MPTLYDKLWVAHVVADEGDGVSLIYIDGMLLHEVSSPQAFAELRAAGRTPRRTAPRSPIMRCRRATATGRSPKRRDVAARIAAGDKIAAKHLARALQRNRRAVLVGETAAGANHYGDEVNVDERFMAFVPIGRTYDPNTGKDWEGSGIKPDVLDPADDVLAVVLRLASNKCREH